jgi:hypothetical protein
METLIIITTTYHTTFKIMGMVIDMVMMDIIVIHYMVIIMEIIHIYTQIMHMKIITNRIKVI